nr:pyruvate phosphate dikinase 2 [Ulva prolifera]
MKLSSASVRDSMLRSCLQPTGPIRPSCCTPVWRLCSAKVAAGECRGSPFRNRRKRDWSLLHRLHVVASSATESVTKELSQRPSVYAFGSGPLAGNSSEDGGPSEQLLGGKGKNLADMSRFGLSVPPGFTVTTTACAEFHQAGQQVPEHIWCEAMSGLRTVEESMGAGFGDEQNPLLVSVRSGAEVSMPGLMDTVLNVGMNDEVVQALASKAGERFAWDSYRRFLGMFGILVLGMASSVFEQELELVEEQAGVLDDMQLSAEQLKEVVTRYKNVYRSHGHEFPNNPEEQLKLAVQAAFNSWESEQATLYPQMSGIEGLAGTAVTVQAMVFGNLGESSGTGVCFTRNPSTGRNALYGEYLVNAQGEDVAAGMRKPSSIEQMRSDLPAAYKQLQKNCEILEREYKDMQDVEFTVQEESLFMLQCRSGKRTGAAAATIACDFVDAGLVGIPDAIMMVEPRHLEQLLQPQFASALSYADRVIGQGVSASPGAAVGKVAFDPDTCAPWAAAGEPVIRLRQDVVPDDLKGMHSAQGLVTQLGSMRSQAAVAARGWGKPCVTGCSALVVDEAAESATLGDHRIRAGDVLSVNGTTGEVIMGAVPLAPTRLKGPIQRLLSWVDEYRTLGVLANADSPAEAQLARDNGAQGIGLVRTEHMLFASDERVAAVRRMVLARTSEDREAALAPIEDFQREDLIEMFKAMDGLPVVVRLLDPPLQEFLPAADDATALLRLAEDLGTSLDSLRLSIQEMQEANPMLGFRGCRLGIAYPEIPRAQVRAVVMAACAAQDAGVTVRPHFMVPLVSTVAEYKHQAQLIREVAQETLEAMDSDLQYQTGSMIETPRAALLAGELAAHADFFSLGTNDLTQMTYGLSRDDTSNFLNMYIADKIMPADPFQVLDTEGVGSLIESAILRGRAANASLKVGLSGEHGGDPSSIAYLSSVGVDYVSCGTARVPLARLSGAQAVIMAERSKAPLIVKTS